MASNPKQGITIEQYLALEANSALDRHEYLNGEVILMAGGTPAHSALSTRVASLLDRQLADSDCTVRGSDMSIRTAPNGLYSYADVVVSCAGEQFDGNILLNPVLIVEVLSDSTESYDRGKKFEFYRQIQSFSEYVVVAQDRVYVEHHVRDGVHLATWTMQVFTDRDDVIELSSVTATLQLRNIYSKVL